MVKQVEFDKISRNKIPPMKLDTSKIVNFTAFGFSKKAVSKVPYKAILKTPAIWGIWFASIGNL